jgi:NTP pyrophosphatase (non-canonical NTP hydrolase)
MTFEEYQKLSRQTAFYPDAGNNYIYPLLGLNGETGEVAEKFKKIIRDKNGVISAEDKIEISKELGDVLWYLAQIASELKLPLEDVAAMNIKKLQDRKSRNVLSGNGDNR